MPLQANDMDQLHVNCLECDTNGMSRTYLFSLLCRVLVDNVCCCSQFRRHADCLGLLFMCRSMSTLGGIQRDWVTVYFFDRSVTPIHRVICVDDTYELQRLLLSAPWGTCFHALLFGAVCGCGCVSGS